MTTSGATEAVTPEQRATELTCEYEALIGAPLYNVIPLRQAIAASLREAETNALRRGAEVADNYCGGNHTAKDHVLVEDIASAIRSLLPKEEGK